MRRVFRLFLWAVAVALVAIALAPFWLGPVVRAVAPRFGVAVGAYSRIGYQRFELRDVVVTRPGVVVRIATLEGDTPLLWGFRHLQNADRAFKAGAWEVQIGTPPPRQGPRPPVGWVPLRAQLLKLSRDLDRWLPSFVLGPGKVVWPDGELILDRSLWEDRTLDVRDLHWRDEVFHVRAELGRTPNRVAAYARSGNRAVRVTAHSAEENTIQGVITAWDQAAPLSARFGAEGWRPESAQLEVTDFTAPAAELGLKDYAELHGDALLVWDGSRFNLDLDIRGDPVRERAAPDLRILAKATGTADAIDVQRLDLEAPGLSAKMDGPVQFFPREKRLSAPAAFQLRADLGKLPWFQQQGVVTASARAEALPGAWPQVNFDASGEGLVLAGRKLDAGRATGRLEWPRLWIEAAKVSADGGVRLEAAGDVDFKEKSVGALRVEGTVPDEWLRPYLPREFTFATAAFATKAAGPWRALRHEGTVTIDALQREGFEPADVRCWWKGLDRTVEEAEAGIRAGSTELVASGSIGRESAQLRKLVWRHDGEDRLALERASTVTWGGTIAVNAFDLVGKAGELRFSGRWGQAGELRFYARGIEAEWWRNFVPRTPFEWSIDSLSLRGSWDNGPVTFETTGLLHLDLSAEERVSLELKARTEDSGLRIEALRALEAGREFASISGRLPLAVTLAPKPTFAFGANDTLELVGVVRPEARWWAVLGEKSGLHLREPDLSIRLRGSWAQPLGEATLRVRKVELDERLQPKKWPPIENIEAELNAQHDLIELKHLRARVAGEAVSLSAVLPLKGDLAQELRKNPVPTLRDHVEVRVNAQQLQLAPFGPFIAEYLLPQGTLDADFTVSARGPWSGYLRLGGVGTRPLGAMGPLREIRADLTFAERRLRVGTLQGDFGGETVSVRGHVEFPVDEEPRFDLRATGKNLPFVRQAGIVLRGDINLSLDQRREGGQPMLTGDVAMHDGLFLSDVRALIPSGGSGPQRRPPYFAVTVAPFNRWGLNVNVQGDRFLRARTTIFNGVASMKFQLLGTLGNPRALGSVRIDDGQVLFPFARFSLQDATVRLTEENPYDPQLAIYGTSRRYGYDLKLELTGSAAMPNLAFSSSPPLSSEQVLLLVMAGETPKNEVTYSTSQRFTRLGTYFGQSLLNSLGGGGSGEDRLTISSGERISRQGRETYNVEYEIDDRWSLIGEYDEFDEYNAGLKWQVLPRPKKEEEPEEEEKEGSDD